MCEYCLDIILRDNFYSPKDYLNCLDYIKTLIADGKYKMLEQTCDLDKVKDENGYWADDIISHKIICKKCGECYIACANTYRGGGSFEKSTE